MTKVLVSPGYGAGWSTWVDDNIEGITQRVAEYQPIIEYIEGGGDPADLNEGYGNHRKPTHPLVTQMERDLGLDSFYTGGANTLEVVEIDGPYLIGEYDGYEYIISVGDLWSNP